MNNQASANVSERQIALAKYNASRGNLLLMIVLSAVNIVLLAANLDVMLLFSASVPYFAVGYGLYDGTKSVFAAALIFAAVCLLIYLLCWLLSKKSPVWMLISLILFVIDTAFMAWLYISAGEFSGIMDAVIHAYVLYHLIVGVINGFKLKKLPEIPEEEIIAEPAMTEETAE